MAVEAEAAAASELALADTDINWDRLLSFFFYCFCFSFLGSGYDSFSLVLKVLHLIMVGFAIILFVSRTSLHGSFDGWIFTYDCFLGGLVVE
jgi:hypothetical protein